MEYSATGNDHIADRKPCQVDTRCLLQRAHIVASWAPIYIGKESGKHWEEGEDLIAGIQNDRVQA
jgi:hypothetical protein